MKEASSADQLRRYSDQRRRFKPPIRFQTCGECGGAVGAVAGNLVTLCTCNITKRDPRALR